MSYNDRQESDSERKGPRWSQLALLWVLALPRNMDSWGLVLASTKECGVYTRIGQFTWDRDPDLFDAFSALSKKQGNCSHLKYQ